MLALGIGTIALLVGCGSSGVPYNATPIITGLFPSNVTAGSDTFQLSIAGANFISNSMGVSFAYWNGSPRSTTYNVSTAQLTVTILASDVANPGVAQITVNNPPPGGGLSSSLTFTIQPVQAGAPTISSFLPASIPVGGPDFALTVNGSNFAANDIGTWNGSPRTTTFVNQNKVTVAIAQGDISVLGTGAVSIATPGLLVASRSVAYSITGLNNPVPSISSVSPSSVTHGSIDFEVTVGGAGFPPSAVVEWGNTPLATAYISSTRLVALIPAADLLVPTTVKVGVTNPPPGGGTSPTTVTFTVN